MQRSLVQGSPSSQLTEVPPTQELLAHDRPARQGSPWHSASSLQHPTTGTCVHPIAGSQASRVQGFPSLQAIGVWLHPCSRSQASVVRAFPSSPQAASVVQQFWIATWVQPVA
jgi:hypothetical protein